LKFAALHCTVQGVCGDVQAVKDLRDSIKLGDTVAVTGSCENEHVLQAVTVTVLQAWKTSNGQTAFKPHPSPLKQLHKKQQQQQQQQDTHTEQQVPDVSQPATAAEAGCTDAGGIDTPGTTAVDPQAAAAAADPQAAAAAADPQASAAGAAVLREPQLAVCKFWVNTGRCAKGDACPYAHLVDARTSWVKRRCGAMLLSSCMLCWAAVLQLQHV
jgi:hypothetical protein